MKKSKLLAAIGAFVSASLALAGCGSAPASVDKSDDGKLMTVDVYDDLANYQGIQKGWFAKIIKDKFNIRLNMIAPNVAGGGSTLFDTRSAAGNLGDLIITGIGGGRAAKLIKSKLVADMSPYMDGMTYIKKYKGATDNLNKIAGQKSGVWGVPDSVSTLKPTQPGEGLEPTFGPYLRWDIYKEIGYPKIKNLDQLVTVLKQMQDRARQDTGKNNIYAMSLFKDWDGNMMNNAKQPTCYYGYDEMGFVLAKANGDDYQSITKKNGIYQKSLEFFQKASQAGIVDPDSTTQNYDTMYQKYKDGRVLFTFWPWLGQAAYNTTAHKNAGKGFMLADLENMHIFSYGATPNGSTTAIYLGAKAKNKQRLVKFINWLYSPEGTYDSAAQTQGAAGPKGLNWTMKNGQPVLTDFGVKAMDGSNPTVPASWGGGEYNAGVSALNYPAVSVNDTDPSTKHTYNASLWPSQLAKNTDALDQDWSKRMGGAKTTMEYLEKNHKLLVAPGASYITPDEPSTISTIRGQVKTEIVADSWKASVAKSHAELVQILDNMRQKVDGLNYKAVLDFDMKCAKDQNAARIAIKNQYK